VNGAGPVMGVVQVVIGQATGLQWASFVLGVLYLLNGVTQYVMYRRVRRTSAETQVQDRAEPR
jgi:uncharacterized membrane protein HdeD (DUF308 family)